MIHFSALCRQFSLPRPVGNRWVRFGLGGILATAASLKGIDLFVVPGDTNHSLPRSLALTLISLEWALALWLWTSLKPRLASSVTMVVFTGFACYSLIRAFQGHATCGCFGHIQSSPRFAMAVDIIAVVLLIVFRPSDVSARTEGCLTFGLAWTSSRRWVWIGCAVCAASLVAWHSSSRVEAVVLDPDSWIGKRFPLLDDIAIGADLSRDKWLVLFYHHDCPRCRDAITAWPGTLERQGFVSGHRLAVVEVPPFGSRINNLASGMVHGQLTDRHTWFVETPLSVTLVSGKVLRIAYDREAKL